MSDAPLGQILEEVLEVILARKKEGKAGSYTTYLFEKGLDKILKKVGEESAEVIIAAKNQNRSEVISESADLLYHLLVLFALQDVTLDDVARELAHRQEKNQQPKEI